MTAMKADAIQADFIGDTESDTEAGSRARVFTIGYANRPGKHERLATLDADLVVAKMASLVTQLWIHPNGLRGRCETRALLVVVVGQLVFTAGDLLSRVNMRQHGFTADAFVSWWFVGYMAIRTLATFGQLWILARLVMGQALPLFAAASSVLLGATVLNEGLTASTSRPPAPARHRHLARAAGPRTPCGAGRNHTQTRGSSLRARGLQWPARHRPRWHSRRRASAPLRHRVRQEPAGRPRSARAPARPSAAHG